MLTDNQIQALAEIVAKLVRATENVSALNAWSTTLFHLLGPDRYVAEVDRTWPLVRDVLDAAEFDRVKK